MSPQPGGLGTKAQDIVIKFCLEKEENHLKLHLRALKSRRKIYLFNDEKVQTNNLTYKYITDLSKLKHLQCYMNKFELEYRKFE